VYAGGRQEFKLFEYCHLCICGIAKENGQVGEHQFSRGEEENCRWLFSGLPPWS
jgi:hypothetical protein